MPLNIQNLETVISTKLKTNPSPEDVLVYAKTIALLKTGTVNVVMSFINLPGPSSVPNGTLYLVKADDMVYATDGLSWRPVRDASSGFMFSWGPNASGQLGDSTLVSKSSPVSVMGGFTDWCQISTATTHSAAVRGNGTLWTWGSNTCGQLGDNTGIGSSSPVQVVGGVTSWRQVSVGNAHTAAVRTNGTLWTWGGNSLGQLGDNTTVSKSSPVSVVGGFTDWCQVSAGSSHTLAIRTNCTLWTWGDNASGKLGDNSVVNKSSPVLVVGGFADWVSVSAGGDHTVAVRGNGTLWAWGNNTTGKLGDNTAVSKSSPVSVVGGFTDWCQVSAGYQHTAAVRSNGTLWAWGCNNCGQLGDNTIVSKSSPVSVVGGFTDWCQVSATFANHNIALRMDGTLWSWGCNSNGQLGSGTIVNRSSPGGVPGNISGWCNISIQAAITTRT